MWKPIVYIPVVLLVLFPSAAFAQGVDAAPDLVEQIANVFGWGGLTYTGGSLDGLARELDL